VSRKKLDGMPTVAKDTDTRWLDMLEDVEAEIQKLQTRLGDLKQSEAIVRNKINACEPFPSGASTQI
jgi:hypothetical protein